MHAQYHQPETDDNLKETDQNMKPGHQCDKFSRFFRRKENLKRHMTKTNCTGDEVEKQVKDKKIKPIEHSGKVCDICGMTFKENRSLKDHIEHVHQKIKYFL